MLSHVYPGLVTFGQNDIQAPVFPVNAVVCNTALTTQIIEISSGAAFSARDFCRRNLDAYLTCVWLGEQASASAGDRTGAGQVEAVHAIHTAVPAFTLHHWQKPEFESPRVLLFSSLFGCSQKLVSLER